MTTTIDHPEVTESVREIPLDLLVANPDNPRRKVTTTGPAWTQFVGSIKQVGILEPIIVRPDYAEDGSERFEIVAGHRRVEGARAAELTTCPAIERDLTDEQVLVNMLVENLQRVDLDPVEEASGFFRLVEIGMTQADMAQRVGRSKKHVAERLTLLRAPAKILAHLKKGEISIEDTLLIAKVADEDVLAQALPYILDRLASGRQPGVEHTIDNAERVLKRARAVQAEIDRLIEAGYRAVAGQDGYGWKPTELGLHVLADLGVTKKPSQLKKKDWLVACVVSSYDGTHTYWCTDDRRAVADLVPAKEQTPAQEKERAEKREKREANKREIEALQAFLSKKVPASTVRLFVTELILSNFYSDEEKALKVLLGPALAKAGIEWDPKDKTVSFKRTVLEFARSSTTACDQVLTAAALARVDMGYNYSPELKDARTQLVANLLAAAPEKEEATPDEA